MPALWKRGAGEKELTDLCNKYEACVAVDWGNSENGHVRFSSAAALNAINELGWGKWSDGCQSACNPTKTLEATGVCHVKQSWFSLSVSFGLSFLLSLPLHRRLFRALTPFRCTM